MRVLLAVVIVAALPLWGWGQTLNDGSLSLSPYMTGLTQPTGFAFPGLNASQLFVIEKSTGIVKYKNGASVTNALDLKVQFDSERGLLGIALPRTFATDATKYVYLYYSTTSAGGDSNSGGDWAGNRLSRFVWNGSTLSGEQELFLVPPDGAQSNGPNHNGGPIRFGPDGKLYGIMGDLNRSRAEQNNQATPNTSSLVGGIFRLNANGTIPSDNPFPANPNPDFRKWYAYGVRNSFGLSFDPKSGALWDTENGPSNYDEVNRVVAGFNSGWTKIMGPDSRDPQNNPADLVVLPNSTYSDPEFSWLNTVAPTGLAFLGAAGNDPAYRDLLIVGDNNTGQLWKLTLNAGHTGFVLSGDLADLVLDGSDNASPIVWGSGFGVTTQLDVGPDGALYVTSLSNGAIYRIAGVPEPGSLLMILISLVLLEGFRRRVRAP